MPKNLLNVLDSKYLVIDDVQSISESETLSDGKVDVVGLLFSDEDVYQYPTYPSDDQDAYEIGMSYEDDQNTGSTKNIPVLLSAGLSGVLGIEAGGKVR